MTDDLRDQADDLEPLTGPELLALTATVSRSMGDYATRADRRTLVNAAPRLLVDLAREQKRAERAEAEVKRLTQIARVNGGLYRSAEGDVTDLMLRAEKVKAIGRAFMEKVEITRAALGELDAAIDRAPTDPAQIRACYEHLVRTLDLPKDLP